MSPLRSHERLLHLSAEIRRLEEAGVNARRVAQDCSGSEREVMAAQAHALTLAGELDMTMHEFVRVWRTANEQSCVVHGADARVDACPDCAEGVTT